MEDNTRLDAIPAYVKLRDIVVAMIIDDMYDSGDLLPSIGELAEKYETSAATVGRMYDMLAFEGVSRPRKGTGSTLLPGARELLLNRERERFMAKEWPLIVEKVNRLGLAHLLAPDAEK